MSKMHKKKETHNSELYKDESLINSSDSEDIDVKVDRMIKMRKNGIYFPDTTNNKNAKNTKNEQKQTEISKKKNPLINTNNFFLKRSIQSNTQDAVRKGLIRINDLFARNKANNYLTFIVKLRQLKFFKKKAKKQNIPNSINYLINIIKFYVRKKVISFLFKGIKRKTTIKSTVESVLPRSENEQSNAKEEESKNNVNIVSERSNNLRSTLKMGTIRKGNMLLSCKYNNVSDEEQSYESEGLYKDNKENKSNDSNVNEDKDINDEERLIKLSEIQVAFSRPFEAEEIELSDNDERGNSELSEEDYMENDQKVTKEYDKFYKEQFFKEEVFKIDAKFKDQEEDEIIAAINKANLKKAIKQKEKIIESRRNKKLPTLELDNELKEMKQKYFRIKHPIENAVNMQVNNTEKFLHRGKMVFKYFHPSENAVIPKFTVENVKDKKGKEIIDFKELSKDEKIRRFYDECPFFQCRKSFYNCFANLRHYINIFVDNSYFDFFSLCVIIANTIVILISDPLDTQSPQNVTDRYFLFFYTAEAVLKIIAYTFLVGEKAYMKDYWNILDFFVIIMGWVSFILERVMEGKKIAGISGLRAFRILRPLKTVKSIKGLKRLVIALLGSISKLSDTAIVLFFFFLLFAVGGVSLWQGLLLKRCMSVNYGYFVSLTGDEGMCSFDSDCEAYNSNGDRYICAKGYRNPNFGITSFDNTLVGFMTCFIIATLEGWSEIFIFVSKTFKDKFYINPIIIFFYFHVYIFIGGFYLMNLFLAVTNNEFTNIDNMSRKMTSKKELIDLICSKYDIEEIQKQEKLKKEAESKNKKKKVNTDDALSELRYKIEDEAYYIEKNEREIPINYTTIKDMYIMKNNKPKELYDIKEMIAKEQKYLNLDLKRQVKEINESLKEQKREQIKNDVKMSQEKKKSEAAKNEDNEIKKIMDNIKIDPVLINEAIEATKAFILKNISNEHNENVAENKKNEDEDKEKKEYQKNTDIKEFDDLKYEKKLREIKKKEDLKNKKKQIQEKKKKEDSNNNTSRNINKSKQTASKLLHGSNSKIEFKNESKEDIKKSNSKSSLHKLNHQISINKVREGNKVNKHDLNIEDELSFIEDVSVNEDALLMQRFEQDNDSDNSNSSLIAQNKGYTKIYDFDDIQELNDNIYFPNPSALMPEILKLKNDQTVKKKIEIIRENFQSQDYLKKMVNSGIPIASVGKRRSFLNTMKYVDENQRQRELLHEPPSQDLFKDQMKVNHQIENIDLNEQIFDKEANEGIHSNISEISSDNKEEYFEKDEVYDEKMSLEEIEKKILFNTCTSYARKAFLEPSSKGAQKDWTNNTLTQFYSQVNDFMGENVILDQKEARGRGNNIDEDCSFISTFDRFINPHLTQLRKVKEKDLKKIQGLLLKKKEKIKQAQLKQEKKTIENKFDNIIGDIKKRHEKEALKIYRSNSIDIIEYKYSPTNTQDLFVMEVNSKMSDILTPQQELISNNLRSKKYYMNYMNNIIDKDIKVKDCFNIDAWKNEILGVKKKEIQRQKLPESTEAVFVFNEKRLNLKKYKYLYHKKFEFMENEYAILTHDLTYLPPKILEITPLRIRDFGRAYVGKAINVGALGYSSTLGFKSNLNSKTNMNMASNLTQSTLNQSKSMLANASYFVNHKMHSDEQKHIEKLFKVVYNKLNTFNYLTLSHYFLKDGELENLVNTDDKRKEAKKKAEIEKNKERNKMLKIKEELSNIKLFDIKTNSSRYNEWSGYDVLYKADIDKERKRFNEYIESIEEFGVVLWLRIEGLRQIQKIKYAFYLVSINQAFDLFIMSLVLANAIVMAMDGNLFTPEIYVNISISNYVFNSIFIAEFIIKLIGLGPVVYFSDAFTYLDLVIIAFAILDMITPASATDNEIGASKSLASQLSFLRVFRIFRVLRLTKILRRLKSMRLIIVSIKKSLADVTYIVLILIMFLLIFQLLGMSLLCGNIRYQSFLYAFYTTFQILSSENWNSVFYEVYPLNWSTFFYYVVWLFLGNYILFNLFISILLQSFDDDNGDEDEDDEDDDVIEKLVELPEYFKRIKNIEKEAKNRMKKSKSGVKGDTVKYNKNMSSSNVNQSRMNASSSMTDSKSKLSSSSILQYSSSSTQEIIEEDMSEDYENEENAGKTKLDINRKLWKKANILFKKNECESSLYIFSQLNSIRIFSMKLIQNKWFDRVILIMILLSTARLILDTFLQGYQWVLVFDILDLIFNLIFFAEMIFKVIALGFVMDEGSYLRDNWNKIDLIIVAVSMFDIQSLVEKYIKKANSGGSSLNFLKVLRLLRTLRPLRFISHNVQLRLIITSLFDSILPITNALFIVLVVFFMFSIVGINLFYNLYHNCYIKGKDTTFKLASADFANDFAENYKYEKNATSIEQWCIDKYNVYIILLI